MYSCKQLIQKRKALWQKYKDPDKDRQFVLAVADVIIDRVKGRQLRKEIIEDPTLLIELVYVIDDKKGNTVPFFLNEAQKIVRARMLAKWKQGLPFRAIILKGRQQGISSFITCVQEAMGITRRNFKGYTVADEDKSTQNLFEKAKSYYRPLPPQLKPTEKYNSKKEFRWAKDDGTGMNSSWGIATAGVNRDGRVGNSFTIDFLHASEVAWWKNIDKTLSGLTDACTPYANIILETTARGYNEFYERWQKAVSGKSEYEAIFIPWYIQKEYEREFPDAQTHEDFLTDIEFSNRKIFRLLKSYKQNIPEMTDEKLWWYYRKYVDDKNEDLAEMQQEYPTYPEEAFQTSGNPVFNLETVQEKLLFVKNNVRPIAAYNAIPITKNTNLISERVQFRYEEVPITDEDPWPNADIYVFEEYRPDTVYVLGADVAEGLEHGDYSSASIFPIDTWQQAVQINGHWEADEFGYLLYDWGKRYGWAYIAVENNNHGLTTNTTLLKELNYPEYRFHFRYPEGDRVDKQSRKMGWWTGDNKYLMIDELRTAAINTDQMIIRDYKTFTECLTYVRDAKGSYNAEEGSHDDRIIDKAISWQLRKYVSSQLLREEEIDWSDW